LEDMYAASGDPGYGHALQAMERDGYIRIDAELRRFFKIAPGALRSARIRRLGGTDLDVTVYPHMADLLTFGFQSGQGRRLRSNQCARQPKFRRRGGATATALNLVLKPWKWASRTPGGDADCNFV
jgi:hypothetical protein